MGVTFVSCCLLAEGVVAWFASSEITKDSTTLLKAFAQGKLAPVRGRSTVV